MVCAVERTVLVSITRVSFAPTVTEEIYATSLNKIEAVIAAAVVFVIEILVTILVLLAGTVYSVAEEVAAAALTNCFATFAILSPSTLPLLYQFLCHKQS